MTSGRILSDLEVAHKAGCTTDQHCSKAGCSLADGCMVVERDTAESAVVQAGLARQDRRIGWVQELMVDVDSVAPIGPATVFH